MSFQQKPTEINVPGSSCATLVRNSDVFGFDDEDYEQDSGARRNGYRKLSTSYNHTPASYRQTSASFRIFRSLAVVCQNIFASSSRLVFLLFVVATAIVLTLIYSSPISFTEWQSSARVSTASNFFPEFSNVSLTPRDAEDAINVQKIVRGWRTCQPVFDEYGRPTEKFSYSQKASSNEKIQVERHSHPFIVHYIRILDFSGMNDDGGGFDLSYPGSVFDVSWQLDRLHYLSIFSAWKALLEAKSFAEKTEQKFNAIGSAEPDETNEPIIYLHSNIEPTGFYYDLLRTGGRPGATKINLKWNRIPRMPAMGGHIVEHIEHEADFHKVNATYTFGGVHMDFDVVLVNGTRLRELQNSAECFISVDVNLRSTAEFSLTMRHSFNFMLNAGLFSCQKQSKFLKIWLDNYLCDYRTKDYLFNSGLFPRLLFENYNKSVAPIALDWQSGMYWRPELLKEAAELGGKQLKQDDWFKFPGLHFYHVEHFKFLWQRLLRNSTSIFAQALRRAQFDTTEAQTSFLVNWD